MDPTSAKAYHGGIWKFCVGEHLHWVYRIWGVKWLHPCQHTQEIFLLTCGRTRKRMFSILSKTPFYMYWEQQGANCVLAAWEWNVIKSNAIKSVWFPTHVSTEWRDELVPVLFLYLEHRWKADPGIHTNFSKLCNRMTSISNTIQTEVNHCCYLQSC